MARRTAKDTARLIEEVARGERLLEEIKDPELRETVRLALRLHKDPFTAPDARTRSRIRSRVLASLRPHGATLADRVTIAFEILAKPAPYAMRAFAVAAIVLTIAASTSVVSSGSVSDDALYSVKLASEQARLALATTPEDRAMVELTIAEHRLAEATELATQGNDDDAIVATSEYGEHLANAAAELAQVETLTPDAQGLVVQLQQKIDTHRAVAAAAVARLADSPSTASAAQVLAVVAAPADPAASDLSPAAAIAAQAATATDQIANVAERKVTPVATSAAAIPPAATRPAAATTRPTAPAHHTEAPRATTNERSRGERAAESARKAADEAKAAAKKAKEGSRRTPTPTPHHP
ncbi:MAG: hypothetical protein E6H81_06580 [Chloroflexi bacterium]|nr:MAG: hypothetical protein E6H81_06580 [Chloroflexota bacterium]